MRLVTCPLLRRRGFVLHQPPHSLSAPTWGALRVGLTWGPPVAVPVSTYVGTAKTPPLTSASTVTLFRLSSYACFWQSDFMFGGIAPGRRGPNFPTFQWLKDSPGRGYGRRPQAATIQCRRTFSPRTGASGPDVTRFAGLLSEERQNEITILDVLSLERGSSAYGTATLFCVSKTPPLALLPTLLSLPQPISIPRTFGDRP